MNVCVAVTVAGMMIVKLTPCSTIAVPKIMKNFHRNNGIEELLNHYRELMMMYLCLCVRGWEGVLLG